jgi:hypothetical protein
VHKQFPLEVEQEQTRPRPHDRIRGHELRMGKALVDLFVDDVGFVEDQVALDEDRHLTVGIHDRNIFGLVEEINITDLEIHALFEQYEPAPLGEWAGRT